MNRHFEDTRYYLKRAGETAKKGIAEELEPIEKRVTELRGDEDEPEPGRLEDLQERTEGEAREAIADAREKLASVTERRAS